MGGCVIRPTALAAPMHYDLCGLDDLIFDVRDRPMERRVEKDRIHHEVFFRAPRKLPTHQG